MNRINIGAAGIVIGVMLLVMIVLPCVITMSWSGKVGMADSSLHKLGIDVVMENGEQMDVEEFLPCVIMAQLGDSTEDEAVKAQMVLVRTRILKKAGENTSVSVKEIKFPYITYEQLNEMYGKNFDKIYNHLLELENATGQQVIKYNGKLINPVYHSVSAGTTRAGSKDYLKAVASEEDITAEDYLYIQYYTPDELEALFKKLDENITINKENPMDGISTLAEDETGYISEVNIGEVKVSGDDFYKKLELNSPCFIIEKFNEVVRIVTKGKGHGRGLSIYGANAMAKKGSGYKEILTHYFEGVTVEAIGKQN